MFLVDAGGQIVHANASGQALLDERSVLRAGGGRVAAIAADADQELNQTLTRAGGGDAVIGTKGIAVALTARDGERYVAHVLPLTSSQRRRACAGYGATAALFVRKAALAAPSAPETIARHYKLTPTELRVLFAVVEFGGVQEVAEKLGIGEATVKDASASAVRQDRDQPSGRARQAGGGLRQSSGRLNKAFVACRRHEPIDGADRPARCQIVRSIAPQ